MKVLIILTVSAVCLASAATVDLSSPLVNSAARKPEKRGIGLGYGLSGLGYDASPLGYSAVAGYHHPAAVSSAGYVAPVAHTTVIKSGYAVPAAAHTGVGYLGGYDGLGKYTGYSNGFYPAGYTTGYSGLGYGAIPVVAGTGYGKYVQPAAATTSYSKVVHSYPHYGTAVGAVAPAAAIGYSGLAAGYHYGY